MPDSQGRPTMRPAALLIVATGLMAIGLVMVASTSVSLDRSLFGPELWREPFGRQLLFVLVGLVVIVVTSRVARPCLASPMLRRWLPRVLFGLTVVLLIAALIPRFAPASGGSHRWLRWAPGGVEIGIQPSEVAKLALVALLAGFLSGRGADPRSLRGCFMPASAAIALCVLLVGKEDFSTSVLLAGVGVSMLFVAGCRLRHLLLLAVLGAGGLTVLLYAAPYRLQRILAFKDLWADPRGAGYQPLQSLAAIASGGWFGTGLGSGVHKYGYLPAAHTDFIFAVICEEMGALGAGMVIALFCVLVWLGARTMFSAATRFERLLAFGLTATLGMQAAMNIAVVTVVTPTTGISLPLISAGGSGLLTSCVAIGLLSAIAVRENHAAGMHDSDDVLALNSGKTARGREAAAW